MWKNISDGETDGLVLMMMRDRRLHAVALTKEQAEMLDFVIAMPFAESKVYVGNKVTVKNGQIES